MKELSLERMSEINGKSFGCLVQGLGGVSVIFGIAAASGPIGWGLAITAGGIYALDVAVNGNQCGYSTTSSPTVSRDYAGIVLGPR